MKKLLPYLFIFAGFTSMLAQTANSVSNGNWTNPFTWDCSCVPTPGYTVNISHAITMNMSYAYTSGSVTINNSGSLIQDNGTRDIWVNGGSLTVNGSLDVRYIWTQSGTFYNSGDLTARSILCEVNFVNDGNIHDIDSIYNTMQLTNNGLMINIDSLTNGSSIINNGDIVLNQFTNAGSLYNNDYLEFSDITNLDYLRNSDTIIGTNSGWNLGIWTTDPGSYTGFNKSFLNNDVTLNDAELNINGYLDIGDSWYNYDLVSGIAGGAIVVVDSSYNMGVMTGDFDFCDLSHSGTAPVIDFSSGTISPDITWCEFNQLGEFNLSQVLVYPNPVQSGQNLTIDFESDQFYTVALYDVSGRELLMSDNLKSINFIDKNAGVYHLKIIERDNKSTTFKIIVL